MRVIYSRTVIGGYDPVTKEIALNPLMVKYPELFNIVVNHELGHAFEDRGWLDYLRRDLKSNWDLPSRQDFHMFLKEYNTVNKPNKKQFVDLIFYKIGSFFIGMITMLRCFYFDLVGRS